MNRSHLLLAAALVIAAAFASTGRAHAASRPYGAAGNAAPQMFCTMPAQAGTWTTTESRYQSNGQCEVLQAQEPANTNGRSEFPNVAASTELAHATWSAIGTYDVATKKVIETIVVPPPPANQPPQRIQVYGLFTLQMTCTADPWLDTLATCSAIRYSSNANGHLGALGDMFKTETRPLSSRNEPDHQALLDANKQRMRTLALGARLDSAARPAGAAARVLSPQILLPAENTSQPAQTVVRVRVAPAALTVHATAYQIDFQKQDATGGWVEFVTDSAPASTAESNQGYEWWGGFEKGLGLGTSAGRYRVRAAADGGVPSDWREFRVTGPTKAVAGRVETRALVPVAAPAMAAPTQTTPNWSATAAVPSTSALPPSNWATQTTATTPRAPSALGNR